MWAHRTIDAPAVDLWRLFAEVDLWPQWGPSVRSASVDGGGPLCTGATGQVVTAAGVRLPFEITEWVDLHRWSWRVAGVPATDHEVTSLGLDRCRVGFGVPWPAAPYLAVCRRALATMDRLAAEA
ncbi:MAG: SRPBCC family protein [Acidimicrobiia bacterium]|nr:SRPBCC family protein [Acidimicrobiia bacterium]